jgi:acyl carrier protein
MLDETLRRRLAARRAIVDNIRDALIECLSWSFDKEAIDPDAFLFGSGLALDSLAALELVSHVERTFDVRLPDDSMNSVLRTVNTLADCIEALKREEVRA